jgi:Fe-S cluster assembly scaffold protein SufB
MIGSCVGKVISTATSLGLKASAAAQAKLLGTPTSAWEDWRYVRGTLLPPAPASEPSEPLEDLPIIEGFHLRFWQGAGVDEAVLPPGWKLSLIANEEEDALSRSLTTETDPSACLGLAYCPGRWRLDITSSHEQPLTIVNGQIGIGACALDIRISAGVTCHLRIQHHLAPTAWSLPRLHLTIAQSAVVSVVETGRTTNAHLLETITGEIARDASLTWTNWCSGGNLVRLVGRFRLLDRGAHVDLAGAAYLNDTHQLHHVTRVEHACGDTTSTQMFRVLLDGESTRSFDGLVYMPQHVEGANAEQQDRNLVLSAKARADSRPQLDIHTDDVKAAHGAAIGQLDSDQLLYLRMRGLDAASAASLLTTAFVRVVTDRLPMELRP